MTTYTCEVSSPHYSNIICGKKTVEGRVCKGKWANMKSGDLLYVQQSYESMEKGKMYRIKSVQHADNFYNLHRCYGKRLLPDIPENDHESADELYREYFKDSDVIFYGVVGIELEEM